MEWKGPLGPVPVNCPPSHGAHLRLQSPSTRLVTDNDWWAPSTVGPMGKGSNQPRVRTVQGGNYCVCSERTLPLTSLTAVAVLPAHCHTGPATALRFLRSRP
jgi:hypothetical protein